MELNDEQEKLSLNVVLQSLYIKYLSGKNKLFFRSPAIGG